ncbi:hypothetical protein RIF29_24768 [Crotalaria pallida]|uniref:Uncharacterized protein n=1 Tax=Crotalaria pallida TaxID=3830 RepID=A0AAN9EL20_CROPI
MEGLLMMKLEKIGLIAHTFTLFIRNHSRRIQHTSDLWRWRWSWPITASIPSSQILLLSTAGLLSYSQH